MLIDRNTATRAPASIRRLGLDFVIFCSVVFAIPWLALWRGLSRSVSPASARGFSRHRTRRP